MVSVASGCCSCGQNRVFVVSAKKWLLVKAEMEGGWSVEREEVVVVAEAVM